MPQVPSAFRHLSRMGVRDRRATVTLSLVVDGVTYPADRDGLPLRGFYGERDVVEVVKDRQVVVSEPWVILHLDDLPAVPKRGDKVVFDDGVLVIADQPRTNGSGSVELVLTRKGTRTPPP